MSDLQWAKAEIASTDCHDTATALQILADASANLELRPQIQDGPFFKELLACFSRVSSMTSPETALLRNSLRCVGNLVADNGGSACIQYPVARANHVGFFH